MSSTDSSPMRYGSNGSDLNFVGTAGCRTPGISNKMRVPRKIRIGDSGEMEGDSSLNNGWRSPSLGSTTDTPAVMQVPDRIIVAGNDQHLGTKALPRELQLESLKPLTPIRIQTPPRQIRLVYAPSESYMSTDPEDGDDTLIVENDRARSGSTTDGVVNGNNSVIQNQDGSITRKSKMDHELLNSDVSEEVAHLREQLSRMNNRVLSLEEDASERKERERYVVMASLLYLAYKTVTLLFRSGH